MPGVWGEQAGPWEPEGLVLARDEEHAHETINDGPGCEECGWNTAREDHMVIIHTMPDGTPDVWADPCIADLVRALGAAGFRTVASCCGHKSSVGGSVIIEWPVPDGHPQRNNYAEGYEAGFREGAAAASRVEHGGGGACCAPSGWHDDGDPLICERPDGHEGDHYERTTGAWRAESDALTPQPWEKLDGIS